MKNLIKKEIDKDSEDTILEDDQEYFIYKKIDS